MTVTITDMQGFFQAEANRTPDKVAECVYAFPDTTSEDDFGLYSRAVPSCIVGCVMVNHLDVNPVNLLDVGQSAMDVLRKYTYGKEFTTDALLLAQVVQRLQDGSNGYEQMPWGRAVELGSAVVFAHVATWTDKVREPNDLSYSNGSHSDLAGLLVQGVYKAIGWTKQF